jgi:hypothetical protein
MASASDLEGQSLAEIAEYHNDAVGALTFFLKSLFQQCDPRFLDWSLAEFNDLLLNRIEETDLRSSLAILAALEAAVKIDYQLRARQRYKDALSREFRATHKRKQDRVRLDEDLLEPWARHYPSLKSLIGEFRAALHFRHWLAHGRYWKRPVHRRFDYLSLYALAELALEQFPLHRN